MSKFFDIFFNFLTVRKQILNNYPEQFEKNILIFTREYTQCTAGYTFCFVVVVVVVVVGVVGVVVATFNQTWQYFSRQLIKHD
jgi:hypothetical protein